MATIVTRAGKGSPLTHDEVDLNFTNLNTDKLETSGDGSGLTNIARKVWESSQGSGSSANYWAKVATYSITGDFDDGTFIYHFMPEELGAGMPAIVAVNVRTNNASGGDSHTLNVELMSKPHATPFSDDSFKLIDNGGSSDIELWVKKNDNNCQISAYEMSAHVEDSGFTIAYNQNAAWQASEPTGSGLNIKTVGVKVAGNFTASGTVTATAFAGDGSALTGLPAGYTDADVDTHLNTSTAANGEVLSWTGTDYDWIAGGGGGTALELYAENPSSPTAPSATGTNAVAIGSGAKATNTNAVGLGVSNAAGINSFAAAGATTSTAYGAKSDNTVAIGVQARALSSGSIAIGSYFAYGSGIQSVAIGRSSTTYGSQSVALGGGVATANYSHAYGVGAQTTSVEGHWAYAPARFSLRGDAQSGLFVLRCDTTDATAEALRTNISTANTTNQIILPNNAAYAFHGTIVARQQASAGTACAAWKVEGLIRREGSAGTTVLVNSATTVLDNTPAWGMALTADTTNGGLAITVTGAAATNIRWLATINTSELKY